jgi:hypothetical protein
VFYYPVIVYCATFERAKALIAETAMDAADRQIGGHVALDIETMPTVAEAEREQALAAALARIQGQLKAARKARASDPALAAEAKLLKARAKYLATAALDPHRSQIRLVQPLRRRKARRGH